MELFVTITNSFPKFYSFGKWYFTHSITIWISCALYLFAAGFILFQVIHLQTSGMKSIATIVNANIEFCWAILLHTQHPLVNFLFLVSKYSWFHIVWTHLFLRGILFASLREGDTKNYKRRWKYGTGVG